MKGLRIIQILYYKFLFKLRHYLSGGKALNRLLKEKKEKDVYVILTNAIGDDVYGLTYINNIKKAKKCHIVILCLENRKSLVECYPGSYDEIKTYVKGSKEWKGITSIYMSKAQQKRAQKHDIYSILPFYILPLNYQDGRNQLDFIRDDMLRLPKDAIIQYPKINEVKISSISDFYSNSNRIVVINPYSSSMDNIDFTLYSQIATSLSNRGYIVYTNIVGNQKIIEGTLPLNCPLEEFYSICNNIPLVISTRSGLIDWSITAKTNFFVIYFPFGNNSYCYPSTSVFFERHTLKAWGTNNVEECIYSNRESAFNEFNEYYKLIENQINKSNTK